MTGEDIWDMLLSGKKRSQNVENSPIFVESRLLLYAFLREGQILGN